MQTIHFTSKAICILTAKERGKSKDWFRNAGSCSNWFLEINYRVSWERNQPHIKQKFTLSIFSFYYSDFILYAFSLKLFFTLSFDAENELDTHLYWRPEMRFFSIIFMKDKKIFRPSCLILIQWSQLMCSWIILGSKTVILKADMINSFDF